MIDYSIIKCFGHGVCDPFNGIAKHVLRSIPHKKYKMRVVLKCTKRVPTKRGETTSSSRSNTYFVNKKVPQKDRALPDTFFIADTIGNLHNVIYLESGKNLYSDGHMPHTIGVVRGEGVYEASENVVHIEERLEDIGIHYVFRRRGPDGEKTDRLILLLVKEPSMLDDLEADRTDQHLINDLTVVKKVTEELNASIDTASIGVHKYAIASPVHEKNLDDGEPVSLDHYLVDSDVIRVMEDSCWCLDDKFAFSKAADMYFNPNRKTYPHEARKYGFIDIE